MAKFKLFSGVHSFKGRFHECVDLDSGERISHHSVPNETSCLWDQESNLEWTNKELANFDNVGTALLSLFQVKRWKIISRGFCRFTHTSF